MLEALSREFRQGMELLYVDNLVAEIKEFLWEKIWKWKRGMEMKGLE